MAPRRNNSLIEGPNVVVALPELQGLSLEPSSLVMENHDPNLVACCVPTFECLRGKEAIYMNNLHEAVKVVCSNEHCPAGKFMHKECFEHWEEGILSYLRSCGRARSWSEKQRHQNLWTKKGYDLAFRSCSCLCGRGFLKKDLDWSPATATANANGGHSETEKKKKKRRQNNRPTIAMSAAFSNAGNGYSQNGGRQMDNVLTPVELRARTVSISSSNGSNGSSSPLTSSNSMSPTIPLPGVIGSGQKKKKKMKKPDP